jgi:subtilase family serine protease
MPDLQVTDIRTKQVQDAPKGVVWVIAIVTNTGDAKAGKTLTEFRLNGNRKGSVETGAIKKGQWLKVKFQWDARKKTGTFTWTVRADLTFKVKESDETNNVSTLEVSVKNKFVTDGKFEQLN